MKQFWSAVVLLIILFFNSVNCLSLFHQLFNKNVRDSSKNKNSGGTSLKTSSVLANVLNEPSLTLTNPVNTLQILFAQLPKISRSLLESIILGNQNPNVLISFFGANTKAIQKTEAEQFSSETLKHEALITNLRTHALDKQNSVLNYLVGSNLNFQSFWSSNQIVLKGASLADLINIHNMPDVSSIIKVPTIDLPPTVSSPNQSANRAVQYNVEILNAPTVWSSVTRGEGVVVSTIDTGVRVSHEALQPNMRLTNNWFDPYDNSSIPGDKNGHGTHTMGTLVGQGGIGMAPGATWIACKGCNESTCEGEKLIACGQWICTQKPNVVSNSWGSSVGNDDWYNPTIDAWIAANIIPIFAIGNTGPVCKSAGSPGDNKRVLGVGSIDEKKQLSRFSSRGTSATIRETYIKPDCVTAGSNVYSAWFDGDGNYNTISGTSMACPAAAGVVALMLAARMKNKLDISNSTFNAEKVYAILKETANTTDLTLPVTTTPCPPITPPPNPDFGAGLIDAMAAVMKSIS